MPSAPLMRMLMLMTLMHLPASASRIDCDFYSTSELPVKVKINIPAFLYFQVGDVLQTPELTYDLSSGLPGTGFINSDPGGHSNLEPTSISGSDASNGVNVTVRANCGQVKLAYSVSDANGLGNGQGAYISYETLSVTSTDSNLPAPALRNAADTESLVITNQYNLVTDRSAVWQYRYNNSEFPAAGVYQGTVTYQATCL